jgi:hypothetical protein
LFQHLVIDADSNPMRFLFSFIADSVEDHGGGGGFSLKAAA